MTNYIPANQRRRVIERADGRCEYCLIHQTDTALFDHEIDHIISEKHGGPTTDENLAFACFECNRYKGSDIASVDSETGQITPLFNPRQQTWADHFVLDGPLIRPITAEGRTTVYLLRLNAEQRIQRRKGLIILDKYPG
jgi:5-methylcytosine-specific restriction endonuclease McrA